MRKKVKKADNLSEWYLTVVQEGKFADYAPVKGTMIIRPNGYALWEAVVRIFDLRIKQMGVENGYFPLFIPMSFLEREKDHVEGFSPELAVVTHGGGKKLEESIAVRPTSETIMYDAYARWITSYRDLPLKLNQWCNVVRWEKRTFPFLRTTEFLWQEGHTAHETHEEAAKQVEAALNHYAEFLRETLALPIVIGKKSKSETFAGALYTFSCEALMPDGKALQVATSHHLGQNFSKELAFNISFQNRDDQPDFVHQTSWGMSTRVIGGLLMTHGDDKGAIIPPRMAAQQITVIPITRKNEDEKLVFNFTDLVISQLAKDDYTAKADDREKTSPGSKFHDWEIVGVPLRIDIGPNEVKDKAVVVVRRDTGEKETVALADLNKRVGELLEAIQENLYQRAVDFLESRTTSATTMDDFQKQIKETPGFIRADWCGDPKCEEVIKDKTSATARVIPFEEPAEIGKCIVCEKQGKYQPLWSKSY